MYSLVPRELTHVGPVRTVCTSFYSYISHIGVLSAISFRSRFSPVDDLVRPLRAGLCSWLRSAPSAYVVTQTATNRLSSTLVTSCRLVGFRCHSVESLIRKTHGRPARAPRAASLRYRFVTSNYRYAFCSAIRRRRRRQLE